MYTALNLVLEAQLLQLLAQSLGRAQGISRDFGRCSHLVGELDSISGFQRTFALTRARRFTLPRDSPVSSILPGQQGIGRDPAAAY